MPQQPIFNDIVSGDLEAVKSHVLADAMVLEEKEDGMHGLTPLMHAISHRKPAIALWLIEHQGQHDLDTADGYGYTALYWACCDGFLSVVRALMAAGACTALSGARGITPLMIASLQGHSDVAAHLLQLPAARDTLDAVNNAQRTALSYAAYHGRSSIVQLLLDAGADPTIPAGEHSPLHLAVSQGHSDIAALLRAAIAEPHRARTLHKARALLDAAHIVRKAQHDARDKGQLTAAQRQYAVAEAPAYLKGRVQRDEPLPRVELTTQQGQQGDDDERVRATAAFVVGGLADEEEEAPKHLPRELFKELLGYMMHAWADKGPEQA